MNEPTRNKAETPPPAGVTDRVLEHEYDGIREYDNPMPRWWLLTFAGTIVFSIVYLFNVGPVGNGAGRIADYESEMAKQLALHPAPVSDVSDATLLGLTKDASAIEAGQKVFSVNCVACHGVGGGGVIGPNLTDEYWLHGGHLTDVHKSVTEGILAKGMPPWGKILKPDQVNAVVAYIASLQGTQPANAKPPQGVIVTP
ncbi:MAG: cbb3-type cytochrome c oxidase N-terminal domain-containing protein [Gemmatimonadaceae bacterium]